MELCHYDIISKVVHCLLRQRMVYRLLPIANVYCHGILPSFIESRSIIILIFASYWSSWHIMQTRETIEKSILMIWIVVVIKKINHGNPNKIYNLFQQIETVHLVKLVWWLPLKAKNETWIIVNQLGRINFKRALFLGRRRNCVHLLE